MSYNVQLANYFKTSLILALVLLLFPHTTHQIGFVQPLTPFEPTFVNTKLPSIYNFHFSLTSGLRSDGLIRVQMPNYTTLGTPTCLFDLNTNRATTLIDCEAIDDSVYITPAQTLATTDEIRASIFLSETIPSAGGYTENFKVSTVSSTDTTTAIIFDTNPGYGNLLWGPNSLVGKLFLEVQNYGSASTVHLQGASNDLIVYIRFNEALSSETSRVVVTLDMPWKFGATTLSTARSPLYTVAEGLGLSTALYSSATIKSYEIVNSQVLEIYFDEMFPAGREFVLTITKIINPLAISSGNIRFYSTDYTSNYVIEANENTILYTAENSIDITNSLSFGADFGGPVQLYKNTEQYVTISFPLDVDVAAGATLLYTFATDNTPVPGTLYIADTITAGSTDGVQYTYGTSTITLTNLGALTAGSTLYIQTKVLFSKVQPKFYTTVSILIDGTVVQFGQSDNSPIVTNGNGMINYIQGSSGESGVININNAGASQIVFSFTTPSKVSTTNSKLTIYTNQYITASGTITCTSSSGITFSTCSLTTSGTYTVITLTSTSGANAFPSSTTSLLITIGNININRVSDHDLGIYEFYLRLDKDGTGVSVTDAMVYAFVRPVRNVLTNLNEFHLGNVISNTLDNYPSFVRVFGTSAALSAITLSTNENLVITIFGSDSTSNNLDVTNEGDFPCGSSLEITCKYVAGNSNALSTNPIDWDRVIITMPSSALSTAFNLYIPQFFDSTSSQVYEFMIGKYHTDTRVYENLYLETRYTASPWQTTTFATGATASNNADLYINMINQKAGITVTSPLSISFSAPNSPTTYTYNTGSLYGAATILITEWQFWTSDSALTSVATPLSSTDTDATVFFEYTTTSGTTMNAVLWPMIGSADPSILFQAENVDMPYSLDTPNYVMYVTGNNGDIFYYNSLINTGRDALSANDITIISFDCDYMIQNYLNTKCSITFTPNAQIDKQSNIKVEFSDATVSIYGCSVSYDDGGTQVELDSSYFTCESTLGEIQLGFDLPEKYPVTSYTFSFYGLDQGSTSSQSFDFSIWDSSYGFVLESTTVYYFLELTSSDYITINSMTYDYLNLDAISNLNIEFYLPRDIYPNENLQIDVGADIQGNNKNTDRLALFLESVSSGSRINIYGALKNQKITIQFVEGVTLAQGYYILTIDNLKTPSTHSSDVIAVNLKRASDDVLVLQSLQSSFTSYPVLLQTGSASISLTGSRFLCVGCLGELTFQVTITNSEIDPNSTMFVHLPSYFLPEITNEADQLTCRINNDPATCATDSDYPYRVEITTTSFYFSSGDSFALTLYGFVVPDSGTVTSSLEDVFFAIDSLHNGTYSEQSFLALPTLSAIKSVFGAMFFYDLEVSSLTVRDRATHVLRVNITVDIPTTSRVTVTFTDEYINLRYLQSLTCNLDVFIAGVRSSTYAGTTCEITGQTVEFVTTQQILSSYSLELTIENVPTPLEVGIIDPNKFVIATFASDDDNDVLAISKTTLNSVTEIEYIDATYSIQANGGSDIVLTRGTWSPDIVIETIDGTRIVQDITITANTEGFTFLPSTMNLYVGDLTTSFRVSCDQNVKLRTYSLNFTQTQNTALVNAYGQLFDLRIQVVDTPVVITIPSSITVPTGGSSLPIAVSLASPPFSSVQILISFDEGYFNGAFAIDEDYSSPSLNFTRTSALNYIAFLTTTDISSFPTSFTVDLYLDGDDAESYSLSTNQITINIGSAVSGSATVTGTQTSVGKVQASFSITPASQGMMIIQLSGTCASKQSLSTIKKILRNSTFNAVESDSSCEQRYLAIPMDTPGVPYTLSLTGLTPETKYNLYVYFEDRAKNTNEANVLTFTFTTLGMISIFPDHNLIPYFSFGSYCQVGCYLL